MAGKITQDELHSSLNTKINKLDNFSEDADGNLLYKNKTIANDSITNEIYKEIANLNLQLQANQRVPNGTTFGTDFNVSFGMTIDYTKTTAIGALSVGTTTIPVQDVTGFSVGKEVTIYDDVNLERVTISAIDTTNKTLTVSALTKSYKDKANIARTMAVADTVNKCLKFGGWSTQTTNTVTDATVVASAYGTGGNGGRKLVRLSNGNLYAVSKYGNKFYVYKSTNNGLNWSLFYTNGGASSLQDVALSSFGNNLYIMMTFNNSDVVVYECVNEDSTPIARTVDSGQNTLGNCSIVINSAGTELHAAWASKNSTYPNSFNIRYAKGTINADGSVTWGAVEQWTIFNTSNANVVNPCIIVKDGSPFIFANTQGSSTVPKILVFTKSYTSQQALGTSNTGIGNKVLINNDYAQYSPSACVAPNGRIWVTWYGTDSTDTTANNIRVAYSDDGGVTWSAMTKLTSGNSYSQAYPSITSNKNNEIFILWSGIDSYYDIRMIKYSGGSWGSVSVISAGTTNHKYYPSALYDPTLDFSTPLFIYQDSQNSKVGFYGTWTAGSTVPILENDIRFTVKNTDEVVAWAERDELSGFTINAQLNGQNMTKSSVSGEDQFIGTLPSVQPAEIKLTMTRSNVNDNVKINKILGGIS